MHGELDHPRRMPRRIVDIAPALAEGSSRDAQTPPEMGDPAIVLIATSAGKQTVERCCERAAAAGVHRGMSLAHARALLPTPQVHVEDLDETGDEAALRALATWATRFAPIVAADLPDGVLIDITGCQRLHRGERRLINAIANSVQWLGFQSRIACASTFACAWAVARFGECERTIIEDGCEREAISPLPMAGLRLEPDTIDALREVNIDRIGQVLDLPRGELAPRFGEELLLRLDQCLGQALETIASVRPTSPPCVHRAFDGPVKQLEGVMITVQELVAALCVELQRRESGVRHLELHAERIDAADLREAIMLSRPSRNSKHLWSLLKPKVESLNLGFGIERLTLIAAKVGRLRHEQIEIVHRSPCRQLTSERLEPQQRGHERGEGELIDIISSRLGPPRAVRVEPVESHLPERAFIHRPAITTRRGESIAAAIGLSPRPTVLFNRPEPAEVIAVAPEGPPSWLRWRGDEHIVTQTIGPERICNEWWDQRRREASTRDYFSVQLESGRWLWVCRHLEIGRWFVHGEWA